MTEIIAALIGVIGGACFQWWFDRRRRLQEEKGRQAAEAELALIKRRGNAPYLVLSQTRCERIYHGSNGGEIRYYAITNANVLSFMREEVGDEMPKDHPVILVVDNSGQAARKVALTLDGQPIAFKREVEFGDAKGLQFIEYPYDPAKRGIEQQIRISFETMDGIQDTHTYRTRHGFRELSRTEPA